MGMWELAASSKSISSYLVDGWEERELSGEGDLPWSVVERPRILIPAPDGVGATLTLTGEPFLSPPKVTSQDVWVFVNGLFVTFGRLHRGGDVTGVLPPGAVQGATISVTLGLPNATRPSEIGAGPDERMLGLAFQSLRLSWV